MPDDLSGSVTNALGGMYADDFVSRIKQAEGSGSFAVSPKGAFGDMQVMPATAASPGFGIKPAMGPEDYSRVGREYAAALLRHYGDPVLASAAYNAGPGRVDQWLQQYGDPRSGKVSMYDWVRQIPYQETRAYAGKFAPGGALAMGQPSRADLPTPDPTQGNPLTQAIVNSLNQHGSPPPEANPQMSLAMLQALLPKTHTFQPVDYDPWKVAPKKLA